MTPVLKIASAFLVITTVSSVFTATHVADGVVVYKTKEVAMKSVDVKAIARELLTKKSYSCLMKILNAETNGLNPKAKNPDSSARGIGQLLSSSYRNLGMKHSSDPKAQLVATLAHIGRKYGSGGPCAAWRFHKKHHYY